MSPFYPQAVSIIFSPIVSVFFFSFFFSLFSDYSFIHSLVSTYYPESTFSFHLPIVIISSYISLFHVNSFLLFYFSSFSLLFIVHLYFNSPFLNILRLKSFVFIFTFLSPFIYRLFNFSTNLFHFFLRIFTYLHFS